MEPTNPLLPGAQLDATLSVETAVPESKVIKHPASEMISVLIDPLDGVTRITPANGLVFELGELYGWLECDLVEVVELLDGDILIIDEEGKLKEDTVINPMATQLYWAAHPELAGKDIIVGKAVFCNTLMFQ